MPLTFDPDNPRSDGGRAIYATGLRISECESWQRVCEKATPADAFGKIEIGVDQKRPWGVNRQYTIEQLKNLFAIAHLYVPDEDETAISSAEKSLVKPLSGGMFMLTIRRHARDIEIESLPKRNNLWLAFFDEMEAFRSELVRLSLAAGCPRLNYVRRLGAPAFSSVEEEVAQGSYLWCEFLISWGDSVGG